MKKIGIYPGTFDPITNGHIDVIKRQLKIVEKLIIAVSNDYSKDYLFSIDERALMVRDALFNDLKFNNKSIKVLPFNTLTTAFASKHKATIIFRGLRAVSDFEYEFQMAGMNAHLEPSIETVFLMASEQTQFISSRLVKEICMLGGDIADFVPQNVKVQLLERVTKVSKN